MSNVCPSSWGKNPTVDPAFRRTTQKFALHAELKVAVFNDFLYHYVLRTTGRYSRCLQNQFRDGLENL